MKKFIVENGFWDLFPDAVIGVVICKNINNSIVNEEYYKNLIMNSEKEALKYVTDIEFSNNEVIKVWRDGFKKFKTKKGARSSIESLLKRVKNGNHIGNINPLVDIYNGISLKYALPCGGEDLDKFIGDMKLTRATGDESFITLGTDKSEPPYTDELIYKDDIGAICRCLNWREAVRTMLTEETKNAILCMELINDSRIEDLKKALLELKENIDNNLKGTSEIKIIRKDDKEIIIA